MKTSVRNRAISAVVVPLLAVAGLLVASQTPAGADPWVTGDVIVGVSNGQYQSFTSTGTLEHTINAGQQGLPNGGLTGACAFNPAGFPAVTQNLYATVWEENKIAVVADGINHTVLRNIDTSASGGTGHPESIVFDTDGNFYVGLVDGTGPNLLKDNKAEALIGSWTLTGGARGVDSIDLDNDLKTIFWTSEDSTIRTFDTSTGLPGPNFASFAGRRLYNLRLLQPGNAFGGATPGVMMVADTTEIKVLDATGAVTNTYGEATAAASSFGNGWFSVSIDATGNQFLAGDFYGGRVVKFNANDTVAQTYTTGKGPFFVNGVCARGEITRGVVPVPDVGFFVVGDIAAGYPFSNPPAGNTVIFHEQNWNSLNSALVSGGTPNNSSFKGFAENANLTTNPCGGTFTSKGGSAGPAAVSVGQRIAVIVTDKVTDPPGGSVQGTGNVIAIILVTVTQYSGGGVPVGKGTVTQVICTT